MKRKILAMLLCVALTVALFGTLAVAAEENVTQPATCTCGTGNETHTEGCALYEAPKDETKDVTPGEAEPQNVPAPVCNCGTETETHAETCPCYVAPTPVVPAASDPVCNCETKDGNHAETCPCYVAPAPSAPVCNCATETETHAETCPCYVAPELTLCEILLATKTLEEYETVASQAGEEMDALTDEEFDEVEAHYIYLKTGKYPSDEPVVDTVLNIVNYTNVAPLIGYGE